MKTSIALVAACIASTSAFAPSNNGARANTQLSETFFNKIFDMDLFAPNKEVNDYGARNTKNVKTGAIGDNSYIPNGLTKEQYAKLRKQEADKKGANYQRNVAKAGKFLDYTQFYIDRGTDVNDKWNQSPTKGHRMAKTKFDWTGKKDDSKKQETGATKKRR